MKGEGDGFEEIVAAGSLEDLRGGEGLAGGFVLPFLITSLVTAVEDGALSRAVLPMRFLREGLDCFPSSLRTVVAF